MRAMTHMEARGWCAYEDGTESVPKRRHIKFRHRGITQKKAYSIQNMARV
jgi:hypothetical protein